MSRASQLAEGHEPSEPACVKGYKRLYVLGTKAARNGDRFLLERKASQGNLGSTCLDRSGHLVVTGRLDRERSAFDEVEGSRLKVGKVPVEHTDKTAWFAVGPKIFERVGIWGGPAAISGYKPKQPVGRLLLGKGLPIGEVDAESLLKCPRAYGVNVINAGKRVRTRRPASKKQTEPTRNPPEEGNADRPTSKRLDLATGQF